MFSFFKNDGAKDGGKTRLWIILIGAVAGVALLLFGSHGLKTDKTAETEAETVAENELLLYQKHLEDEIKSLCSKVKGVGEVTAIVTLEGGFSTEYATEWKDGNESYVILGSGSSQSGLFLSRSAPKIAGIGIVASGGSNAGVKQELTALLSATFNLPSNRIYVTQSAN